MITNIPGNRFLLMLAAVLVLPAILFAAGTWGEWRRHDAHPSLMWRLQYDHYNASAKKHHWNFQIRNDGKTALAVSYALTDPGERPEKFRLTRTIRAGRKTEGVYGLIKSKTRAELWLKVK